MKYIWSPWRMSYIQSNKTEDRCAFCIEMARSDGPENLIIFRGQMVFLILNRFPYTSGHLMIVPFRHAGDLSSLRESELDTMIRLIVKCEKALAEGMKCMGINGGWNLGKCAGAGIEGHIHLHMLPRWSGDANFMTTVSETRVISSSLEDSYERLKPFFGKGDITGVSS